MPIPPQRHASKPHHGLDITLPFFLFASPSLICDITAMTLQMRALSVHLLTATGAVFAMLAMLAAVDGKWDLMFLWLVVAFFVDGIDGPLARKYDVKTNAPEFDGVLLDLIIDYLTYVFIPAFALFKSGLMDGWSGWAMIIIVTFASAMYFADTRMKTKRQFVFWISWLFQHAGAGVVCPLAFMVAMPDHGHGAVHCDVCADQVPCTPFAPNAGAT